MRTARAGRRGFVAPLAVCVVRARKQKSRERIAAFRGNSNGGGEEPEKIAYQFDFK